MRGGTEKNINFRTSSGGGIPKYERENFMNNHSPYMHKL